MAGILGGTRSSSRVVLVVLGAVLAAVGAWFLAFGSGDSAAAQRWGPNDPDPPFGLFETENVHLRQMAEAVHGRSATPKAQGNALGDGRFSGTTATASSGPVQAAAAGDTTLPVGQLPTGVAVNATRAYVANAQSNSVSVIDLTAIPPSVVATIPVGAFPVGVALSADGSQAYVTNYNANTLSIISTATNSVTNTVPVGSRPNGVVRVGSSVYVANLTGNSISVVNPATAAVTSTVVLGGSPLAAPAGLAANAAGTRLYATDAKNGRLIVLDLTVSPPTVLSSTTAVGSFPAYLSVAGNTAYVANPGSNNVSVVNLAVSPPTVTASVTVGTADYGIVAQPSLGQVFVTNSGSNNGTVIDTGTNTAVGTFATGTKPNAIALTPDGTTAVFSNQGSNNVSIVHVNQKPVNAVPGAQTVNANGNGSNNTLVLSPANGNALSSSDDSGANLVKLILAVDHGTLSMVVGGSTLTAASITVTTLDLAGVNTALANGVTYKPANAYVGGDTLTMTLDDQGHEGIGKPQRDVDTVSINVVNTAPTAGAITFTGAVGNTIFGVGTTPAQPSTNTAGNVLSNSSDPNNQPITAVAGNITTAKGGTVSMNANGTFTYISAPGATLGNDTFTFQVSDGITTSNGTATVTVADRVWYVNNALGVNGNGTSVSPYNTLANLRGADLDVAGDYIFLYQGNANYTGGLPLESNQKLIGQPEGLVVGSVTVLSGSGTNPTITNANVAGVGIVLAQNNVIRRVNVANTNSAGINGSGINNTDIGPDMTISGSGGAGFSLFGGGSGTVTFAANITHGSAVGRALFVGGRTGGTVTISGSVTDTAGGVGLDTNGGTTINLTGGLSIATTVNEAFRAIGGGTVNVTGTNTLSATTAALALEITNTTIGASGVTFRSVSKNGGANGIVLNNTGSTGGLTVTGTGGAGSGGTIQNTTGDGISLTNVGGIVSLTNMATSNVTGTDVLVNGGGANVTYTGTITNQAAKNRSVIVQNKTGGTVAFSGAINDQGTGISLSSNTGATVNFTGGVTVSATGSNHAFSATGGGTVNVTGAANTLNHTSGTGAALNVQNTTIGASGLTFKSVSANGGDNGIVLVSTGSGALTVTGDGTAGSGGTIQNITGADGATSGIGVRLSNASNMSLTRMNLHDFGNWAIQGSTVNNFTLAHSTINGTNGTNASLDEGSVRFTELTGSVGINNTTIQGGIEDNVTVVNSGGTLNRLTFDTVTIGPNSVANGNDGISLEGTAGTFNVTVQNSTFTSAGGDLIQLNALGTVASDLVFQANTLSNNHANISGGGGGTTFAVGASGDLTYNISNNTFRGAKGSAIVVSKAFGGAPGDGTAIGQIRNNTIGVSGVANSGSSEGSGIAITELARGVHTTLIDNNLIYRYSNHGILLTAGGASQSVTGVTHDGDLNATIQNNTIAQPNAPVGGLTQNGIHLNSGTNSGGGNDNYDVCLALSANTLTNSGALGGTDYRLRQRFNTDVRLPGYTGPANGATDAALTTYLTSRTTGAFTLSSSSTATGGFFNTSPAGSACPLPA